MANEFKPTFIKLLEEDIALWQKRAQVWKDAVREHGASGFEGIDGKPLASADEIAERYRREEEKLRQLLSKLMSV